jgi:hypothetical protein
MTSWSRCDDSNKWGIVYKNGKKRVRGNVLAVHMSAPLSRISVRMPAVNVTSFGDRVCERGQGRVVVI